MKNSGADWGDIPELVLKKTFGKTGKNRLQFRAEADIIMERDCDRYAMKREVAARTRRFFRGVCPISNRANSPLRRALIGRAEPCADF